MDSPLRSLVRLSIYLAWTLLGIPTQVVALALGLPQVRTIPVFYHRVCCRIIGLHLDVRGAIARERPMLYAVNHTSYLDIAVLGALIDGCFVAKREVSGWPLFGLLARLQRTVFVDRQIRDIARQRDMIADRLRAGDRLILFPEGTSSDGNRALPFKSALFSVAETRIDGRPVSVQPVSVAYTRLDGMPIGRTLRPFFAWYGDMELAPHIWRMAGFGKVTVVVEFHPPVTIDAFGSRKALSDHCHSVVADGVAAAISGRLGAAPQLPAPAAAGRGGFA